jgi:hypothetical protein
MALRSTVNLDRKPARNSIVSDCNCDNVQRLERESHSYLTFAQMNLHMVNCNQLSH